MFTYEWVYITASNVTNESPSSSTQRIQPIPPARQQQTASVVNNNLYIFGGKTDLFITANATYDEMMLVGNHVYGDIWKMILPHNEALILNYTSGNGNSVVSGQEGKGVSISQSQPTILNINGSRGGNIAKQGKGVSPKNGRCITKIQLRLSISHTCINQLRISIKGPGDLTGSANYQPFTSCTYVYSPLHFYHSNTK